MRVLMTGGGTGGHVNPALAIANMIKTKYPDACIEFVASSMPQDKANDLVPRAGYKLHKLDVHPSYRAFDPRNLKTLYYMLKSNAQAKSLIEQFKPDFIIGTGGYACYPALNMGAKMGIPTLVHESNAKPGRAVIKVARVVDCVMTNFEIKNERLWGARRVVRVGNPLLFDASAASNHECSKGIARKVVSFGGSRGSQRINEEICRILPGLAKKYPQTEFYIASGTDHFEWMTESFKKSGLSKMSNVKLVEYIYDMKERMASADLMICRAGAMTISELSLMGKAAIIVPLPDSAGNHQHENAKALSDKNACRYVAQSDFEDGALERALDELIVDGKTRAEYSENIRQFADPMALDKIFGEMVRLFAIE